MRICQEIPQGSFASDLSIWQRLWSMASTPLIKWLRSTELKKKRPWPYISILTCTERFLWFISALLLYHPPISCSLRKVDKYVQESIHLPLLFPAWITQKSTAMTVLGVQITIILHRTFGSCPYISAFESIHNCVDNMMLGLQVNPPNSSKETKTALKILN